MIKRILFLAGAVLLTCGTQVQGQTVLAARQQELTRIQQLASADSGQGSLLVNAFERHRSAGIDSSGGADSRGFTWKLLPATLTVQNNSQLPYDWNLGAMVPARWLQTHISAGIQARWRKWRFQLAPEWVGAQNKPFETMSQELNPRLWRDYFIYYYNIVDIPERMAEMPYRKLYPGQSSLSYSAGAFRASVSTGSKWWGPGYRNALVLSSNAPGFLHLSLATHRPLQTRWGTVEGEFIAGNLVESGIRPVRSYTAYEGRFVYPNKNTSNRYLTGLTLNWQPRWVPGLYLGMAKASYLYPSDIGSPLDVLPLQGLLGRRVTGAEREDRKASLGSFFMRLVLPREHAEVYVEYGRKDRATMPWNILSAKPQRNGFVAGFRKLVPAGSKGAYLQVAAEITQLQAGDTSLIRQLESWYTHNHVRQGYTHLGRSLGAGIGPGSNSQMVELAWLKGNKRVALQLERLRHNGDYYYAAMTYLGDYRRHWVNLSSTLKADWAFGKLNLHGSLGMIRSLNHQWVVVEARPNYYFAAGNEYLNIGSQLSVQYRF